MRKRKHSNIGWCHETRNPIGGCLRGCQYCYVDDFETRGFTSKKPAFYPDRLEKMEKELSRTEPSRVFVGSTGDMWGPWIEKGAAVTPDHVRQVIEVCRKLEQHRFIFLTKFPDGYARLALEGQWWLPGNCWCGTSITGSQLELNRLRHLRPAKSLGCAVVSVEPYICELPENNPAIYAANWIIIGGRSKTTKEKAFKPPEEWIGRILRRAQDYRVPVYVKENAGYPKVVQEFPGGLKI